MGYKDQDKQREYQRERVAKTRREWLEENGPCKECGSGENLQVDHIDPSQKTDHKVWSWAPERRALELSKCQVLCKPCHLKKTITERAPEHGNNSRYTSPTDPCRCAACTEAHRVVNSRYR